MISILLPTYNSADTIRRSINSIVEQTFIEFELLVLDDGSKDSTSVIVHSINDKRIRYIELPHRGLPETLNAGLHLATYDIIARMDADDIALPSRLMDQYNCIMQKDINFIVSCRYAVFRNGRIQYTIPASNDSDAIKLALALHANFPHPGVMFFKKFIIDSGMYRNVPLEDYDLWLRIRKNAEFIILQKALMLIEHRPYSLMNNDVLKRNRAHYMIQEPYFGDLVREFGLYNSKDELSLRGWREYFYGNPARSRQYWRSIGVALLFQPRILLAWLVTYLPNKYFVLFKESRMRYRCLYYIKYFSIEARHLRKILEQSLISIS